MGRASALTILLLAACSAPASGPSTSSYDRIAAAQARGAIDEDTALLYQLYATYDPASLPADYRGDDTLLKREGTLLFQRISRRFPAMAAPIKSKVQPFLLPPDDETSFWASLFGAGSSTASAGLQTEAAPHEWSGHLAGPIVISARTDQGAAVDQAAAALAAAFTASGMYATERHVMLDRDPCPDPKMPLLVDLIPINYKLPGATETALEGNDGVSIPVPLSAASCQTGFILINQALAAKPQYLSCVLAHELFHAFQFTFNANFAADPRDHWWAEASADWAMDLVYPAANCEQLDLQEKTNTWSMVNVGGVRADGPLDAFALGSFAQYSAYLWPFYMTRGRGEDPTLIGQLWATIETTALQPAPISALEAMAALPFWDSGFKEFALWNWNKDPAQVYADNGVPIAPSVLQQKAYPHEVYDGDVLMPPIPIKHASVVYHDFILTGSAAGKKPVKKLVFDLSPFKSISKGGVQAILRYHDSSLNIEDWTGLDERHFCRDIPAEDIDDIVLVVSNGDTATDATATPTVTGAPACAGPPGTFTYDGTHTTQVLQLGADTASGGSTFRQTINSTWTLTFVSEDANGAHYTFTSEDTIAFSGSANATVSIPAAATTAMETETVTAMGTIHNPPQPGELDYPGLTGNISTLLIKDNQFTIDNWPAARLPSHRSYQYSSSLAAPPPLSCTRSETGTYVDSLPGYQGLQTGCGSPDMPITIVDPNGPPYVCPPAGGGAAWKQGTFDPTSGVIHVDVTGNDSDCSDAAGSCYEPYTHVGSGVGEGPCTNSWHVTLNLKIPPRP